MQRIDLRGILWYLGICFGLSWSLESVLLVSGVRFDQAPPAWATPLLALVMLVPAFSAFIVRRFITREGFGTAGLRFGNWRPYLAMALGIPVLFLAIYGVSALLGLARFDPSMSALIQKLSTLAPDKPVPPAGVLITSTLFSTMTFAPLITALATFGEEFGWTGFLVPKLLPLGKWKTLLIYGTVWGLWHAPIVYSGYNFPGYSWGGVLLMIPACIALASVLLALRLRYDSVLVTTWFHAQVNTHARGLTALIFTGVNPVLGGAAGAIGWVAWFGIGLFLLTRTEPHGSLAPDGTEARR